MEQITCISFTLNYTLLDNALLNIPELNSTVILHFGGPKSELFKDLVCTLYYLPT